MKQKKTYVVFTHPAQLSWKMSWNITFLYMWYTLFQRLWRWPSADDKLDWNFVLCSTSHKSQTIFLGETVHMWRCEETESIFVECYIILLTSCGHWQKHWKSLLPVTAILMFINGGEWRFLNLFSTLLKLRYYRPIRLKMCIKSTFFFACFILCWIRRLYFLYWLF